MGEGGEAFLLQYFQKQIMHKFTTLYFISN